MEKKYLFFGGILILVMMVSLAFAKPSVVNPCPIKSDTDIVVYGDTGFGGVGTLSKSWISHFLDWWKIQDPTLSYVFVDKTDVASDCDLSNYPNVKLYIQPGGNAYYQQRSLGSAGKANILDFLDRDGGAYLGICAGFYYAANDYYWQGSYYNWPDMLDRFSTVEGSITDIADYDANPGYALTSLSNGFNAIYYGGPTRGWRDTPNDLPAGASKLASFSAIPGELPAVIQNGKMLLTSVHLEAFENDGISGLSTEQRTENYKLLANLINGAAGTSFYVPAYASPMQCNDGIDNDGDLLIDLADAGCSSVNDNDETDPAITQCNDGIDNDGDLLIDLADTGCVNGEDNDEYNLPAPLGLFSDDFNDGNLDGWVLSAVSGGNNWAASTLNPYEGSYSAESKPMSTTTPASVMEKTVSTVGYGAITLRYYRRLVALDVGDEFQVKWFDGTTWQILEQTGSASANDAGYVYKEYSLPMNAGENLNFAIRFECTAGAVSEFCRVDDIEITGQ